MKLLLFLCCSIFLNTITAQNKFYKNESDGIPPDLPLPTVKVSDNPSEGYLFASLPYWGIGNTYLAIYNNAGMPVFFRKTKATCTDFKLHDNGLITYFDTFSKKFYAMDSTMAVVDSFWVQNGYTTDEHDIKFLKNGCVLLIGLDYKLVDMSLYVEGGKKSASVVLNVIQEIDRNKNLVFEWKSEDHYKYTDASGRVNLSDESFVHCHINSLDIDTDGNLIVSARNLNEISKIDIKSGNFIWRLGGKNNQFSFVNDSLGFSAQHAVTVLPGGNLLLYDNGLERTPQYSRAVEYKIDEQSRTASAVWSYRNQPDIVSNFWGNAQRLPNGNTLIGWGLNKIAATEINPLNEKVYEIEFPQDVYCYRIFRFKWDPAGITSVAEPANEIVDFELGQNYPNPFNPTTKIKFGLPQNALTKLIIYDLLGREVSTIINSELTAGFHEVEFNAGNLSSGIYFYRLQVNDDLLVRKMILTK